MGSLVVFFPVLVAMLVVTAGSADRRLRGQLWAVQFWGRAMARLLGIRVRVEGETPRAPCLLAPNHVGYIDIVTIAAACPTAFLSRADVASWPILGFFASRSGTLFINRGRRRDTHALGEQIADRLERGGRVVVFLEGKAGPGDELLPFRSSMLDAAAKTEAACVPIAVRYEVDARDGVAPADVIPWVDDTHLTIHVGRLVRLRRITATVRFLPARRDSSRKRLAAALENDVREALGTSGALGVTSQ